jgi:hypothetical protein
LGTRQGDEPAGESKKEGGTRSQAGSGAGRGRRNQNYEVRHEGKKTRRSAGSVKKAVKNVGNSRKRVEKRLAR